jgi:hypothetical protein
MNVFCVNKFEKPPDQNLIFVPDRLTARYPQYLKRFRAGDIYGVVFPTEIINDRNFAACATIPGVRKLRIENCPNLTVKSLPSLYKFDCLKDFRYRNGPFSVKDIIKMPRFNYLTTLYFDGKNASELLSAARQAGRLEKLDLLFSPLTEEDFDTISNMTPLQMLAIGGATITSPEVQKLAKLPRLKELYLNGCKISDDALPQFKQLKVLNKLGIQNCRLSAKKRHALEASLPQVLLK